MAHSKHAFQSGYSHLILEDNVITEVQQPQEVTPCQVSRGPCWGPNRRLPVCLGLLSVLLLLLDIGLGIHYSRVRDGHFPDYRNITDMSSDLTRLRSTYEAAVRTRGETGGRVASETTGEARSKQMLEHHRTRTKDYEDRITFFQQEKLELTSKLTISEDSCRRCLMGWTLVDSRCFYFPFSKTPKPWDAARESCVQTGGKLAVIDSIAKQMAISKLINDHQLVSRADERAGYWLGLRMDQGGVWRWLGGAELLGGYWNSGEQTERLRENCAATYASGGTLQSWNNTECRQPNKWICEMGTKQ